MARRGIITIYFRDNYGKVLVLVQSNVGWQFANQKGTTRELQVILKLCDQFVQ
jgi:hypothetical protein